jgi:transposase
MWAAAEALSHGHGGIAAIARVAGISRDTIERGIKELRSGVRLEAGQVRRPGAGRPRLTDKDPTLLEDLQALVDPDTRGDPMSPLRWTTKSLMKLAGALATTGHTVSDNTVGKLLRVWAFGCMRMSRRGRAQSIPIATRSFGRSARPRAAITAGQPVISVDTKKRELVGDFKAVGRQYEPTGKPVQVRTHDFKDKQLGHAIPYGVYDIAAGEGMVSVGVTKDTSQFAVASILAWWQHLGRERYPDATTLTITADGGPSNSEAQERCAAAKHV